MLKKSTCEYKYVQRTKIKVPEIKVNELFFCVNI